MDIPKTEGKEIRIAIIGKTGVGKSALGNSLLKSVKFPSSLSSKSVTSECSLEQRDISRIDNNNKGGAQTTLKVLDTPGLFDTKFSTSDTLQKVVKCLSDLQPGPHIFMFVLSLRSRFTEEERKTIEYLKDTFGDCLKKFGMVVFTNNDALTKINKSVKSWMSEDKELGSVLEYFNHRYASINNDLAINDYNVDVDDILNMVRKTIDQNASNGDDPFYKNEMYKAAEKLFIEKKEHEAKSLAQAEEENKQLKNQLTELQKLEENNNSLLLKLKVLEEKEAESKAKDGRYLQQEHEMTELREKITNLEKKQQSEQLYPTLPVVSDSIYRVSSAPVLAMTKETSYRTRGRLPEVNLRKIRCNYRKLLREITDPIRVCFSLYQRETIDEEDMENIQKTKDTEKSQKLLDIISTCGDGFESFINCLKETGHIIAAEILETTNEDENPYQPDEENHALQPKSAIQQNYLPQIQIHPSLPTSSHATTVKQPDQPLNQGQTSEQTYHTLTPDHTTAKRYQTTLDRTGQTPRQPLDGTEHDETHEMLLQIQNSHSNQSFFNSCLAGTLEDVQNVVKNGFGVNEIDSEGRTPLLFTSMTNIQPSQKIEYILSKGGQIEHVDNDKNNILHLACLHGTLETVTYLVDQNYFNINCKGSYGRTPVLFCGESMIEPVEKIRYLISRGGILHAIEDLNNGILQLVSAFGTLATLRYLVEAGLDINRKGNAGRTSILSCSISHMESKEKIKYLSSFAQCNVNDKACDKDGMLHLAGIFGSLDTLIYLVDELHLDVNSTGNSGRIALLSCSTSAIDAVGKIEFLLSRGGDLYASDDQCSGLLHLACLFGTLETVQYLLGMGLDPLAEGFKGETSFYYCGESAIQPDEKLALFNTYNDS